LGVKFRYTDGSGGWRGVVPISYIANAPWLTYNIAKMKKLGWEPRYSSDGVVKRAIKDVLANNFVGSE